MISLNHINQRWIIFFCTGQETGWSPPSWSSLSDLISRVMEKQAPGILLTAPDRTRVDRVLDVFVDYVYGGLTTDGLQRFTSQPPTTIPKCSTIHAQTQANFQFYSQLLSQWGGNLISTNVTFIYFIKPGYL